MVTPVTSLVTCDRRRNERVYRVRVVLYLNYTGTWQPDWVFGDMRSGTPSCDREKPGGERGIKTIPPRIPAPTGKENQDVIHKNAGAVTPIAILMGYAAIPVYVIDLRNAVCG